MAASPHFGRGYVKSDMGPIMTNFIRTAFDDIFALAGQDITGDDTVQGLADNDNIQGGAGNDTL